MDNLLLMNRSTPHHPAELLYSREIRTKLYQLQKFNCEQQVRDCDSERKRKACGNEILKAIT